MFKINNKKLNFKIKQLNFKLIYKKKILIANNCKIK